MQGDIDVAQHGRQDVVEVVRHAAGEDTEALGLLELRHLLLDAGALVLGAVPGGHVADHDEDAVVGQADHAELGPQQAAPRLPDARLEDLDAVGIEDLGGAPQKGIDGFGRDPLRLPDAVADLERREEPGQRAAGVVGDIG